MRNILLAIMLVACLAVVAAAQTNNKYEIFGGFSVASFDTGLGNSRIVGGNDRETALGFDTSVTGYLTDHLGIEGNFDGHFKNKTFVFSITPTSPATSVDVGLSSYNFMAGPHYRFSTTGRVTPFVRGLVGGNHSKASNANFSFAGVAIPAGSDSETDFAMKLGGGVDIGWTKRAAVRLSADYNPIFQKADSNLNPNFGSHHTRNDVVFSVGVVLK